jgi:hypothetical protein
MRRSNKNTPEKSCLESIPFAVVECTERTVYDANRSACRIFGSGEKFPVPFKVFFGETASPRIRRFLRNKNPSGRDVVHDKDKVFDIKIVPSVDGGNRRFIYLSDVTDIFGRIEKRKYRRKYSRPLSIIRKTGSA